MSSSYSQFRALKALTKGSLLSMVKSPSAIFFSIAFPLIFIVAFGLMGGSGFRVDIAMEPNADTNNLIYKTLALAPVANINSYDDTTELYTEFRKGKLGAILDIQKNADTTGSPYLVTLKTCEAAGNDKNIALQVVGNVVDQLSKVQYPDNKTIAEISMPKSIEGREYKYLDFFLPGMLGFSLLSAGIFGTAFLFFNLRQTLVLKRFFATPVRRSNIIFAEGFSRLIMQLISASVIILVGHFVFGFTLVHGFLTYIQMILLAAIGLILFLGMGFIISSVAKSEASIPPLANMITMPQLLLSGVFLGVSNFPAWLQPICKALPLTQLNNAMRAVAFEGRSIIDCWKQIGILGIWGLVVYIVAIKVFRWE
ncbi:MAG: ABC transporter permease [Chitinophagaceae bacterium]|nr:ABC transporter permease [Chitinophagaceae bacterium]